MTDDDALLERLATIRNELSAVFIERDEVVEGLLCALLAGEHVLLLGPVGTAKSALARNLCERITHAATHGDRSLTNSTGYFSWLLTKFSTPEELFGPISLAGLENDEYRRVLDGKLPTASIAFLDEIFKSSSAILNALLSLMNERIFHNGRQELDVPLISLIGASNELPEEDELRALYDRFLLRFVVDYIQEDFRFLKMLTQPAPTVGTCLTLAELGSLQRMCSAVELPEALLGDIAALRKALNAKDIVASDRRYRLALDVIRAKALLSGRQRVDGHDLTILEHVLWSDPTDRVEIRTALRTIAFGHEDDALAYLSQAREVRDYALRNWSDAEMTMRANLEAHTKLKNILASCERLLEDVRKRARDPRSLERTLDEIRAIQREVLERSLEQ